MLFSLTFKSHANTLLRGSSIFELMMGRTNGDGDQQLRETRNSVPNARSLVSAFKMLLVS